MPDVLVIEDDPRMRRLIAAALVDEGHRVEVAEDGLAGLLAARERRFDVALLDVALPGMSGIELCRHLRREQPALAILMITARDGVEDRIVGLDAGADDYLVKPFALSELAARIRAVLRRATATGRLEVGDVVLDPVAVRASVGERVVPLSVKEFGVLRVLAGRPNVPVDRRTILTEVWGDPDRFDGAIVDQYVSYVRKKLGASGSRVALETVRGVGYLLRQR
jgi:two-component system, OmpR family, response regulator